MLNHLEGSSYGGLRAALSQKKKTLTLTFYMVNINIFAQTYVLKWQSLHPNPVYATLAAYVQYRQKYVYT